MTNTKTSKTDSSADAAKASAGTTTAPRKDSKIGKVIALLERQQGATLDEMIKATGWQSHSVRAALTGLKKKGHEIVKSKRDDVTCYSIEAGS